MGKKTAGGEAVGEGVLIYENKDSFQGIFNDGILNRWEILFLETDLRAVHGPIKTHYGKKYNVLTIIMYPYWGNMMLTNPNLILSIFTHDNDDYDDKW